MSKRGASAAVIGARAPAPTLPPGFADQPAPAGPPAPEPPPLNGPETAASPSAITMYDAQGQPVPVEAGKVKEAYDSGALGFAAGQTVQVKKGNKVFAATPDKLDAALSSGYVPATQEEVSKAIERKEYSGFIPGAEAFGAGVARGLSFGGSDVLASAIGGKETREKLEKLKEHRPILSTTGEITGAIAPVLATGGAAAPEEGAVLGGAELAGHGAQVAEAGGGLARQAIGTVGALPRAVSGIGHAAEHAVQGLVGTGAESFMGQAAQKILPMAAQGAAEGSFYGMGHEISESALGDKDLTAEKLIAAAGHGALLGGAGGAILGAGETAVKAVGDKAMKLLGRESLEDFFTSMRQGQTAKAIGADTQAYRRLGEEKMKDVADTVWETRLANGERLMKPGDSVEAVGDRIGKALDEQNAKLASLESKAGDIVAEQPHLGPDVKGFLGKVDSDVIGQLRASNIEDVAMKADKVERAISRLRGRAAGEEAEAAPQAESMFGGRVPKAAEKAGEDVGATMAKASLEKPEVGAFAEPGTAPASPEAQPMKPLTLEELIDARKDLDSIIYPKVKSGVPPPPPEHQMELLKVRGLMSDEIDATFERAAKHAGDEKLYTDWLNTKKTISNLIPAQQMTEKATEMAAGRNFLPLSSSIQGGAMLSGMMSHGVGGPGAMLGAAATGLASKVIGERGNSVMAYAADKMAQFAAIQRAVHHVDTQIENGVDEFLTKAPLAAKKTAKMVGKAWASARIRTMDELEQRHREAADNNNPGAHAEKLANYVAPIAQHAPILASTVSTKASQTAQNIQNQLPKGRSSASMLQPSLNKPRVPESDLAKQARYEEAATNPLSTLQHMKQGTLSREAVKALEDNSPKLLDQIKQTIMDKVAEKKTDLPYEKRIQLGKLFNLPTDPTLEPQFVASINQMYDDTEAKQNKQGGNGGKQGARRPAKNLAGNVSLPAQNLQSEAA